jgi:hypothetical protein
MEYLDPALISSLSEQLTELNTNLQNQQSFAYKWLPSIIGLASVLVAFAVGFMSFISAKEQIRTSRLTTESQIKSAAEIAKSQLDNAKEITISQIRANLITASRKDWVENLRRNITEMCSLANKIHKDVITKSVKSEDFDKMWQTSIYIELLLNRTEVEHNIFLEKQSAFTKFCAEGNPDLKEWSNLKSDYLSAAKIILKSEWEKVKSLS